TYTPAAGTVLNAGNGRTLHVTFTPNDIDNFNSNSKDVTISVLKAALTVTPADKSRVYGYANPAFTGTITGIQNGDNITASYTTTATQSSPVGTYDITATLSDPDNRLGNYDVTLNKGTLTITKRAVTVTADAKTKTYGDADPSLTYKITSGSLAAGDSFTGALTRAAGENVGTYAIQQGTLALSSNYDLTYIGADLTITKRAITVTADAQTKVYGNADPSLTYKITSGSLAFGDTFTGALSRVAGENVGSYAIQQGTLALSTNYDLTYVGANLTITKRAITVTADAKTKTYGDADPALTYKITSGALAFSDTFTGGLTRVTGENVGAYAIQQGILALSANYDLTYVGANLTITARPVTVMADAKTKTYGDGDPALTYQITSGSLAFSDTFAGSLTRIAGEHVGSYAIQQGTLTLSANYTLTYVAANLTISARPITVTADAQSKVYGNGDPALTYKITSG